MKILENIAGIAEAYDGYVLDLWGVVHDGRKPYPGVPEALAALKARGKRIVFLTNAPRRAWFVQGMLDRMGLDRGLYDGIMSSGEASWRLMKEGQHPWFAKLGRRVFHIGPERDLSVVEDGAQGRFPAEYRPGCRWRHDKRRTLSRGLARLFRCRLADALRQSRSACDGGR